MKANMNGLYEENSYASGESQHLLQLNGKQASSITSSSLNMKK